MSNKFSSSKFAELTSSGLIAIICGISAISFLFQTPIISFLAGTIGIVFGIATLKMQGEKLEKIFAVIGIILSVGSIIYITTMFFQ